MKLFENNSWYLEKCLSRFFVAPDLFRGRISLFTFFFSLVFLSACTDYVSQIDDRYGEWETSDDVLSSSSTKGRESSSASVAKSSSSVKTTSSSSAPKSSSSSVKVVDPADVVVGSMTDSRDGQKYKTVKIGEQIWMAQNLNYETVNSFCYKDNTSYCAKYGRLYIWAAAMDSVGTWSTNGKGCGYGSTCSPTYPVRGVCPEGWHLPTQTEWRTLFTAVGGQTTAGSKLMSTSGWYNNGNGTDAFLFSALPAGYRFSNGGYNYEGYYAYFWSSTESDGYDAYFMGLYFGNDDASLSDLDEDYYGFSVRCLQDDVSEQTAKSSSSAKKVSSSSVTKSSNSVKTTSSSSAPKTSKVVGTCAPDNDAVNVGDKVSWKFTKDDNVSSTDLLSAAFQWTFEGGTPGNVTAKGANGVSQQVTYASSGEYRASLVLSIASDSYLVTCSPVLVAELTAKSSSSVKASSSSVAKSSSSVKAASSSSVPKSSSSSVEVVDPADVVVGSMTDSRDGRKYKTVKIGMQTWMAQNLNYETENSYCYHDTASYCDKYGRLYTWAAAMDSAGIWSSNGKGCGYGEICSSKNPVRGVCPEGWRLPAKSEWYELFETVGGDSTAGAMFKSSTGWQNNGNGLDAFEFAALPAGNRDYEGGYIIDGFYAYFWSSTQSISYDEEDSRRYAYCVGLFYHKDYADLYDVSKLNAFSVRCLKD